MCADIRDVRHPSLVGFVVLELALQLVGRHLCRLINQPLSESSLRRRNVSTVSDEALGVPVEHLSFLNMKYSSIADFFDLKDEIFSIRNQSPNTVVFSKAVLVVVWQVDRLVDFQMQGLLDLHKR